MPDPDSECRITGLVLSLAGVHMLWRALRCHVINFVNAVSSLLHWCEGTISAWQLLAQPILWLDL